MNILCVCARMGAPVWNDKFCGTPDFMGIVGYPEWKSRCGITVPQLCRGYAIRKFHPLRVSDVVQR